MNTPRRLLPSIASLRALEALDRLGSASAAAAELSLTQGAVSRQIQALESQMGVNLVDRGGKKLGLTPAARDFAGDIRQALGRIAAATLRLQSAPTGGALNLAILPTFGMRWLVPRLPGFTRQHPDVTLNMATRLVPFEFADDPFDAAIRFGTPDWPGTRHLLLRHEQVLPVAAPGLLDSGRPGHPQALLDLPLLHIQTRPRAWADWFVSQDAPVSGPIPGMIYDQFSTITQAALHGLGVALMPDYLVEEDIATGRLVPVYGPAREVAGGYYLVWPDSRDHHGPLTAFREWLAGHSQPEDILPR